MVCRGIKVTIFNDNDREPDFLRRDIKIIKIIMAWASAWATSGVAFSKIKYSKTKTIRSCMDITLRRKKR